MSSVPERLRNAYGRGFHTKGKSLISYANDLDQQACINNASTFQAWGRRDLTGNSR